MQHSVLIKPVARHFHHGGRPLRKIDCYRSPEFLESGSGIRFAYGKGRFCKLIAKYSEAQTGTLSRARDLRLSRGLQSACGV